MLVARHLRRAIGPELSGRDLDRAVDATFDSYARYWVESFRLPGTTFETLDAAITVDGFEHITGALEGGTNPDGGERPGRDRDRDSRDGRDDLFPLIAARRHDAKRQLVAVARDRGFPIRNDLAGFHH